MERLSKFDGLRQNRLVDIWVVLNSPLSFVPGYLRQIDIEKIEKADGLPNLKESVELVIEKKYEHFLEGREIKDLWMLLVKNKK